MKFVNDGMELSGDGWVWVDEIGEHEEITVIYDDDWGYLDVWQQLSEHGPGVYQVAVEIDGWVHTVLVSWSDETGWTTNPF